MGLAQWLKKTQQSLNSWGRSQLDSLYSMTPQASAMRASEQAQLRAEQRERDYNHPKAQMARYAEAGLNPALMYGGGSPGAAGNVGSSAPKQEAPAGILSHIIGGIQLGAQIANVSSQTSLRATQEDVNRTRVGRDLADTDRIRAQTDLIKSNPFMRADYVDAIVENMVSVAEIKSQESQFKHDWTLDEKTGVRWERGYLKMQRELDLLAQQFKIDNADLKLKAEVFQSKQFENALKEIQVKWMTDGDITPQHIYQGVTMLLQKFAPGLGALRSRVKTPGRAIPKAKPGKLTPIEKLVPRKKFK